MDNMLEHPGIELQLLIKKKGLTQKAFASILGKKVSEVNELLKGKRNITIQRDYLLHQTLGTPIKYWILKQIDYDYSLLDIEETDEALTVPSPNRRGLGGGSEDKSEVSSQQTSHSEADLSAEESSKDGNEIDSSSSLHSSSEGQANAQETPTEESDGTQTILPFKDGESFKSPLPGGDLEGAGGMSEGQGDLSEESQEVPTEESNPKDDEDLRNRAKIFRTF